ncbi:MAG TPA: hypothetical protein VIP46_15845 [Pyrinomonadaceae bacterium]
MEGEKSRLLNVLRRTARMLLDAEWGEGREEAAAFCAEQYNRVLARLKEMTPDGVQLFDPLPSGVPPAVTAAACWQLAAYHDDGRAAPPSVPDAGRSVAAGSETRGGAPDAAASTGA